MEDQEKLKKAFDEEQLKNKAKELRIKQVAEARLEEAALKLKTAADERVKIRDAARAQNVILTEQVAGAEATTARRPIDSPPLPTQRAGQSSNRLRVSVPLNPGTEGKTTTLSEVPDSGTPADTPVNLIKIAHHEDATFPLRVAPGPVGASDPDLRHQLSGLRERLEREQKKVDSQIQRNHVEFFKLKETISVTPVTKAQSPSALLELARKNGGFKNIYEPEKDPIHEFNELKYIAGLSDGRAKGLLLTNYPDPAASLSGLDTQQQALLYAQEHELDRLRVYHYV